MIQFKNENCCVFESALFKTTSTVLWTDDLVLVVDPTWLPHEVNEIRQFTDAIKENRPVYLLFTHSDYDHVLGFGAFPDAKVFASKAFVENPDKAAVLNQIRNFDHEYYIDRPYQVVYPEVDEIVTESGQEFLLGKTKLAFYLAPGHNPDGIFALVRPLGIWIVGDYLSNVEFPYIYHSYQGYNQTLAECKRIVEMEKPDLLIPGHGSVTTSKEEMNNRIRASQHYLDLLKESVKENELFPEEALWERYNYPLGMKSFHDNNLKLIKRELFNQKLD